MRKNYHSAPFYFSSDCPVCGASGQKMCQTVSGQKRHVYVLGWRRYLAHDGRQVTPGKFLKKWEVE